MIDHPFFRDRRQAGAELAKALSQYRDKEVIVFGLPRGGVVTARAVADVLHAPLDVLIVRKLRHPIQKELAIGAITDAGEVVLNSPAASTAQPAWLEEEQRQLRQAQDSRKRFVGASARPSCQGKVAIVIDDGIATGSTMKAALGAIRSREPAKVVVAAPVAPPEVFDRFQDLADDVVVPHTPQGFYAIGQFYEDFSPVEDEEVIECLRPTAPASSDRA